MQGGQPNPKGVEFELLSARKTLIIIIIIIKIGDLNFKKRLTAFFLF